ncbi:MAG: hypothetical protein R3Y21_05290 [Mycoplasmatota bacterium]
MVVSLDEFFQIIIYILLIVLLISTIILVIRLISTSKRVNVIVDDTENKLKKLNGIFDVVDMTSETISRITEVSVSLINDKIIGFFSKKKGK